MNRTVFFSLKRFFGMVAVFAFGLTLVACAGTSKQPDPPAEEQVAEQKGSLSRIFTIVDEQGRKSGTLTLKAGGGAVLCDENGKVIGNFRPEAQSSEVQSKPEAIKTQSESEKSEVQSKPEAIKTQSESEKSEVQSKSETTETQSESEKSEAQSKPEGS